MRLVDRNAAALPLGEPADHGEPDAALAVRGRLLRGPSVGEDQLALLRRDSGARVAHPEDGGTSLGVQLDLHARVEGARDRVERVVHQVPDDRDEPPGIDQPVRELCPVGDPEGHAALCRDGGLADQQRGEQRILDLLRDLLGGGPMVADHLTDEVHGVVVHFQFEQPQQRVHAVGVLVVLGPQGVDQAARRVEFPAELLQLGAVAQGGHGAAVVGGHAVGDQDALPADGEQVGARHAPAQDVGRTSLAERLVGGAAEGLVVDAEQAMRLVVEEADAAGAVQGDDALPDAVQHRLALREQRRDVRESQVTGLPLDPPGDHPGGQRTDGQGAAGVREQFGDRADELGPHAVVLDPDRDCPDDLAFGVPQRHLAAGRPAQGALVDFHDVLAGQGVGGVGGDDVADLRLRGVRPANLVPVQDHDVLGVGGAPDPLGLLLHRAGPGRRGGQHPLGDVWILGRRLGDGQGAAHRLVVQLLAQRGQEQSGREHRDPRGDHHLHQQYLREHPLRQAKAQAACGGVRLIPTTVRGPAGTAEGGVAWIS